MSHIRPFSCARTLILLAAAASLAAGCAATTAGTAGRTSPIPATVPTSGTVPGSGGPACPTSSPPSGPADAPVENLALSVTAGVNAWIRNPATEPLSLAAYVDGRVIVTQGTGSWSDPLPTATVGTLDHCRLAGLIDQVAAVADLPMGEPWVTDQGTTVITVRGSDQRIHRAAVYAFGLGDEYLPDATTKANRARLTQALAAVSSARTDVHAWTPNRLRLARATFNVKLPTHRWPGPGLLADVAHELASRPCVAVSGEQARRLTSTLGGDDVLSAWVDGGPESAPVSAFAIGLLLPGQPDCS